VTGGDRRSVNCFQASTYRVFLVFVRITQERLFTHVKRNPTHVIPQVRTSILWETDSVPNWATKAVAIGKALSFVRVCTANSMTRSD
jgi:hypothetical protein